MPTVYTAIFGAYDDLKEPLVITPGWQYICFTDQDLVSRVWKIVKAPHVGSPRRTSKLYKIMFHLFIDDEISIWVDASFIINCNLDRWMKRFRSPMTLLQHPKRDCVYEEAAACIRNKRDKIARIQAQTDRYRKLGLPAHDGMAASGIMMREKTGETIQFAETWYEELQKHCHRDQISYAYANWKYPIAHLTNWDYTCRHEFLHVPHLSATDKRKARLDHYKKLKLL